MKKLLFVAMLVVLSVSVTNIYAGEAKRNVMSNDKGLVVISTKIDTLGILPFFPKEEDYILDSKTLADFATAKVNSFVKEYHTNKLTKFFPKVEIKKETYKKVYKIGNDFEWNINTWITKTEISDDVFLKKITTAILLMLLFVIICLSFEKSFFKLLVIYATIIGSWFLTIFGMCSETTLVSILSCIVFLAAIITIHIKYLKLSENLLIINVTGIAISICLIIWVNAFNSGIRTFTTDTILFLAVSVPLSLVSHLVIRFIRKKFFSKKQSA